MVVFSPGVAFELLDGTQAAAHADELQELHAAVYADPPYGRTEDAAQFAGRFRVQRRQPGFALTDLLVRASWRRQGIGATLHDLILAGRPEERATLTVLPAAIPAQNAFGQWGWRKVAGTRDGGPG